MNRKYLRRFENLIMITFPVVLFAGCAGSDIKPLVEEKPAASYSVYTNPIPELELEGISILNSLPDDKDPAISDDTPSSLSENNMNTEEQHVASTDDNTASIIEAPETSILYFATDDYQLLTEQQDALKQYVKFLMANPNITLVINGHADIRGTESYNQTLSDKRAQSVYDLLIAEGVPPNQLTTVGFGELQPLQNENHWDENRRVELQFESPVVLSSRQ
jgi:outer membrane protein OmpA-like peptidoglycan-associated protein